MKTKTKTKSQIKKEAKALVKELKAIYNKLDNLMDESAIIADACTETEVKKGKADEFSKYANIIQSSRNYVQLSYDDLESVN